MSMTAAGCSIAKLAKARGVSTQTVRNWRRMKYADLTGKHLTRTGLELGVAIIWLAEGIGSPTPVWLEHCRQVRFAVEA